MARFRPFRGIRYAKTAIDDIAAVVAPPYDVIDPAHRDRLIAASPFNVTRLILNPEGHDAAAEHFRAWQSDGVLAREDAPVFYLYAQDFDGPKGPLRRVGVIGALHLEPFSAGVVLPHETTFAHHKKDRLELTGKAEANLSPIFGVFSNPEFHPKPDGGWDSPAEVDVEHEGVRHRLWVVHDQRSLEEIESALDERSVFIADGHHRYETALNYHALVSDGAALPSEKDAPGDDAAPSSHVLAFLAAFEDPGMVILPTHRELVSSGGADHGAVRDQLKTRFDIAEFDKTADGVRDLLAALAAAADVNAFAIILAGLDRHLLIRRPVDEAAAAESPLEALDVRVLHEDILGAALTAAGGTDVKLAYSIDAEGLIARVGAGDLEGAFLMNATRPEQMADVCHAGELMPQKSTYFYPKLLSGLVFHSLAKK